MLKKLKIWHSRNLSTLKEQKYGIPINATLLYEYYLYTELSFI